MTNSGKRRVVVTGAAGTIGQSVTRYLKGDFDLVGVERSRRGDPSVATVTADLADLDATTRALEGAAAVVHLAAAAQLDAAWESVLRDNMVATYNVFEAARLQSVDRVVLASSHHVVGIYEEDGAPEIYDLRRTDLIGVGAELRPDSLYAVSKIFGESLGRYYHERHGMAVICLRIGVVREDDDPASDAVAESAGWLSLTTRERYARTQAVWLSGQDAARLIRCALDSTTRWAVVYGTSDNPRVLWDPAPARDLLGYHPMDRPRSRIEPE